MKWIFGSFVHTGLRVVKSRTLTLFAAPRPRVTAVEVLPRFLERPRAQA